METELGKLRNLESDYLMMNKKPSLKIFRYLNFLDLIAFDLKINMALLKQYS